MAFIKSFVSTLLIFCILNLQFSDVIVPLARAETPTAQYNTYLQNYQNKYIAECNALEGHSPATCAAWWGFFIEQKEEPKDGSSRPGPPLVGGFWDYRNNTQTFEWVPGPDKEGPNVPKPAGLSTGGGWEKLSEGSATEPPVYAWKSGPNKAGPTDAAPYVMGIVPAINVAGIDQRIVDGCNADGTKKPEADPIVTDTNCQAYKSYNDDYESLKDDPEARAGRAMSVSLDLGKDIHGLDDLPGTRRENAGDVVVEIIEYLLLTASFMYLVLALITCSPRGPELIIGAVMAGLFIINEIIAYYRYKGVGDKLVKRLKLDNQAANQGAKDTQVKGLEDQKALYEEVKSIAIFKAVVEGIIFGISIVVAILAIILAIADSIPWTKAFATSMGSVSVCKAPPVTADASIPTKWLFAFLPKAGQKVLDLHKNRQKQLLVDVRPLAGEILGLQNQFFATTSTEMESKLIERHEWDHLLFVGRSLSLNEYSLVKAQWFAEEILPAKAIPSDSELLLSQFINSFVDSVEAQTPPPEETPGEGTSFLDAGIIFAILGGVIILSLFGAVQRFLEPLLQSVWTRIVVWAFLTVLLGKAMITSIMLANAAGANADKINTILQAFKAKDVAEATATATASPTASATSTPPPVGADTDIDTSGLDSDTVELPPGDYLGLDTPELEQPLCLDPPTCSQPFAVDSSSVDFPPGSAGFGAIKVGSDATNKATSESLKSAGGVLNAANLNAANAARKDLKNRLKDTRNLLNNKLKAGGRPEIDFDNRGRNLGSALASVIRQGLKDAGVSGAQAAAATGGGSLSALSGEPGTDNLQNMLRSTGGWGNINSASGGPGAFKPMNPFGSKPGAFGTPAASRMGDMNLAGMKDLSKSGDINKGDDVSIWRILTNRYFKTAAKRLDFKQK